MKTFILAVLPLLVFAGSNFAAPTQDKQVLVCTLTNEKVISCCCEKRDGKLYCTKAKKEVKDCCCKPAENKSLR